MYTYIYYFIRAGRSGREIFHYSPTRNIELICAHVECYDDRSILSWLATLAPSALGTVSIRDLTRLYVYVEFYEKIVRSTQYPIVRRAASARSFDASHRRQSHEIVDLLLHRPRIEQTVSIRAAHSSCETERENSLPWSDSPPSTWCLLLLLSPGLLSLRMGSVLSK